MKKQTAKLLTSWIPFKTLRRSLRTKLTGITIEDNGINNVVIIDNPDCFTNASIHIHANNSRVHIKNAKYIKNTKISIYNGDNQTLIIEDDVSAEEMSVFLCGENSGLTIEKDCMLSSKIEIWTADGHSVIDKTTGKCLNAEPEHVIIGAHTWIARGVKLLKRAKIPANTIVGASSVVSKPFTEQYTLIAGNPAKVVKSNILWKRDDPHQSQERDKNEKSFNKTINSSD